MLKFVWPLLAALMLVQLQALPASAQAPQINVERGLANYRAVQSGTKRFELLSPQERNEVIVVARALARSRAPKETSACKSAWDRARSAADDVASEAGRLKNCVESGDLRDECYSAFSGVKNAHSDYESAVSEVNSYCQ